MSRKVKHPEHVNHERWLVSYADFITLLFATFTILFAISNVEKEKLAAAAQSLNKAFSSGKEGHAPSVVTPHVETNGGGDVNGALTISIFPNTQQVRSGARSGEKNPQSVLPDDDHGSGRGAGQGGAEPTPNPPPPAATPSPTPTPASASAKSGADPIGQPEGSGNPQMAAKLRELMEAFGLAGKVDVREEQRGTVISLGSTAFFDEGQVDVKPASTFQLDKVVNALRDQHFQIRVEGHTDNKPIGSGRYSSNLVLSTLRAANIVDFMIKQYSFPPELLSSAGYGEYKPVADNATPEGRQKNRRVDIVILNQMAAAQEPKAAPQSTPASSPSAN